MNMMNAVIIWLGMDVNLYKSDLEFNGYTDVSVHSCVLYLDALHAPLEVGSSKVNTQKTVTPGELKLILVCSVHLCCPRKYIPPHARSN